MKTMLTICIFALLLGTTLAIAQGPPPAGPGGDDGPRPRMLMRHQGGEGFMRGPGHGGGMHGGMHGMGMGKWWKNSELVQRIGLTDAQSQQIEKIFQEHRLQLIDLHAGLEKQEALLEPMMESDRPDEAQVNSQIDRIAQARGALEKSNAQMLLGVRRVLSVEQWKKLHQGMGEMHRMGPRRDGPGGDGPRGGVPGRVPTKPPGDQEEE